MSERLHGLFKRLWILFVAVLTAGVLLLGAAAIDSDDSSRNDRVQPGEVTSSPTSTYLDRTGRPTVVGEVRNGLGTPIMNVSVSVDFYEDGDTIDTVRTSPFTSTVASRSAIPYAVRADEGTDPDDYSVNVSYDRGTDDGGARLRISDTDVRDRDQNSVIVVGTVENVGDDPVERPTVVATFYDEEGSVIGARTDTLSSSSLEPGESSEFRIRYSTLGDVPSLASRFDDFDVVAYGD